MVGVPEHRGRIPLRTCSAATTCSILARRLHLPEGRGRQGDVHLRSRTSRGRRRQWQDRPGHAQGRIVLWRNINTQHGRCR